jgi:hypothetical protein
MNFIKQVSCDFFQLLFEMMAESAKMSLIVFCGMVQLCLLQQFVAAQGMPGGLLPLVPFQPNLIPTRVDDTQYDRPRDGL